MIGKKQDTPHKKCFKCGAVLPLTEFYRHSQMADGHLNKCKACTKRDVAENRNNNRQYYHEYDRERNKRPRRRRKKTEYTLRSRRSDPQRHKARTLLWKAVRNGEIHKLPCAFCGTEKVEAHHHDYSKPLDVVWVCFKCHRERFHGQTVTAE